MDDCRCAAHAALGGLLKRRRGHLADVVEGKLVRRAEADDDQLLACETRWKMQRDALAALACQASLCDEAGDHAARRLVDGACRATRLSDALKEVDDDGVGVDFCDAAVNDGHFHAQSLLGGWLSVDGFTDQLDQAIDPDSFK